MSIRAAVLAAAVLAAPLAAAAQPAATARTAPSDDLGVVGGADRYLLSDSPSQLIAGVDPASARVFLAALRPNGSAVTDGFWSRLMSGAVQFRRELGDVAATLWFNPALDGGLVVGWRKTGAGWTAVSAAPILGETLRGERAPAATPLPRWVAQDRALARGLSHAASIDLAVAAYGAWPQALDASPAEQSLTRRILFGRVAHAQVELMAMQMSPGYGHALTDARNLMTQPWAQAGQPAALRTDLAALGAARTTIAPIAAYRRPDGWSVLLQSPDAPAVAWLAHYGAGAHGEAWLAALDAVPLLAPATGAAP